MNLDSFQHALVLAPHTDDGEIGAGATIARLVELGCRVSYVAFSSCEESVPAGYPKDILKTEVTQATRVLGIKSEDLHILNYPVRKFSYHRQEILEDLIQIRASADFDLILLPATTDVHQDHATISQEGIRAFKNNCILGYELLWNNLSFSAIGFVKLQEHHVLKKHEAMQCYQSQSGRDYMSRDMVISSARIRGIQIKTQFAEAFEVIRWIME